MVFVETLILGSVLLFLLYKWSIAKYNTLTDRGVLHEKPKPLIGTMDLKMLTGETSFIVAVIQDYKKYKGSKVYGTYSLRDPLIFIRDIDLIKKVGIKDFDNFTNHRKVQDDIPDNVFAKSLISLEDRKWKEMRNTLTPAFTGSKMRLMYELINECCIEGVKYIESETKANGKMGLEMEMKDYFTRFANDVIGSTAFGIKVNSYIDKTNEFYSVGKSVTNLSTWLLIKAMLFGMIPKIMKALRIKLLDAKKINYFRSLVFDAIKYRKEHQIVRPDMIHLLVEAKRVFDENKATEQLGEHAEFNDDDLLAQCLLFFFAGFDTVSTALCFTTYELLMNPDVQERLYQEILDLEKELDGKPLNYDALMKMKYMDMVLSESLRKWPPAVATDRQCSQDYKLFDDEGNLQADLKKGDMVFFPIVGIQRDPEYFADPDQFDPERFSDERKHEINPMTYLPFGVGPRNCIGNRLALMEVKSIIYHILLKFKFVAAEKTCKDMMNSIRGFQMQPKDLFWVKFIPRED